MCSATASEDRRAQAHRQGGQGMSGVHVSHLDGGVRQGPTARASCFSRNGLDALCSHNPRQLLARAHGQFHERLPMPLDRLARHHQRLGDLGGC